MVTTAQRIEFFSKIGPLVQEVATARGYGNAQIYTCIAQAACESAYGTASLMVKANAYFGIKATGSWCKAGGKVYNAKTKECYDGANLTTIDGCFRAYDSALDSIKDYFNLMEWSRYSKSLKATTVLQCITIIKNAGYATDPNYITTICSIYETYKTDIEKYAVGYVETSTGVALPVIKRYSKGNNVKLLQQNLNDALGCSLEIDGSCGPKTVEQIKAFQKKCGLKQDGSYGPLTYAKMKEVLNGN